jgi:hypothetical protein
VPYFRAPALQLPAGWSFRNDHRSEDTLELSKTTNHFKALSGLKILLEIPPPLGSIIRTDAALRLTAPLHSLLLSDMCDHDEE